jgi:catechol 2,3-dioxygenase-like lactoylglutathione lyase family enzyme
MEMKLELVLIPVADVDRAKTFYVERLGFVEDVDVQLAAGVRAVDASRLGLLDRHGHRIAGL